MLNISSSEAKIRAIPARKLDFKGSRTGRSGALDEPRNSGVQEMTTTTFAPSAQPAAIPVGEVLPWAIFGGLMLLIAIYFVGAEEGATSLIKGMYVHEFLHDGRHLLGFPCH
jgi:Probable cobalt transporter subunit (CbtB)